MSIPQFDLKAELAKCKTTDDLTGKNGLIQRLIGGMLEQMLQKEMDEHLGYEKHRARKDGLENARNGKTKKNLKSNYGEIELNVPRDRKSGVVQGCWLSSYFPEFIPPVVCFDNTQSQHGINSFRSPASAGKL